MAIQDNKPSVSGQRPVMAKDRTLFRQFSISARNLESQRWPRLEFVDHPAFYWARYFAQSQYNESFHRSVRTSRCITNAPCHESLSFPSLCVKHHPPPMSRMSGKKGVSLSPSNSKPGKVGFSNSPFGFKVYYTALENIVTDDCNSDGPRFLILHVFIYNWCTEFKRIDPNDPKENDVLMGIWILDECLISVFERKKLLPQK